MFENFVGNSMKRWKILIVVFTLVIVGWICFSHFFLNKSSSQPDELGFLDDYHHEQDEDQSPLRIVHFDLKGAPPKMMYLKEILPMIVASGGNALLIEYEDMFPFEGNIKNISSVTPYSKEQIKELLQLCDYYNMEVIPLVQTFGHLEFVLKLPEFAHLRESDSSPAEICPSNSETLEIIEDMLMQVIRLHPNMKRIHIGSDEVFNINICPRCIRRNVESREIFVQHVKAVSNLIKSKYPKITPIIWDDMLRTMPAGYLDTVELNKYVEPMVWVYSSNILKTVPHHYWYWYFKHFRNIWIAGAFKGATGPSAMIPNITKHYENTKSWLTFISKHVKSETKIMGYVLTAWSRYDHFASICELLPAAIPSLVLNLLMITSAFTKKINIVATYDEVLKCRQKNDLRSIIQMKNTPQCVFPGQELIPLTFQLISFYDEIDHLYYELYETNAWMSDYHLLQNYANGFLVRKQFEEHRFQHVFNSFEKFCQRLRFEMSKYYNDATVDEWFLQHVQMYSNKLEFLNDGFVSSTSQNTWGRRNV